MDVAPMFAGLAIERRRHIDAVDAGRAPA